MTGWWDGTGEYPGDDGAGEKYSRTGSEVGYWVVGGAGYWVEYWWCHCGYLVCCYWVFGHIFKLLFGIFNYAECFLGPFLW